VADNIDITPGSGKTIGTDEVTIGAVLQHVQRMKLVDGTDGGTELVPGTAARGLSVDPRAKVIRTAITPTISTTPAYTAGDVLGTLQTISNAARTSGGTGQVLSICVLDKTQAQRASMDLLFFDRTVTVAADNAAVAMSDADMAFCLGVIPIYSYNTAWPGTPLNSISTNVAVNMPFVLNGTDLFVVPVVRTTPTYVATNDLVFTYTLLQD
jgi:hypothetical protein